MEYRKLGDSNINASAITFGAWAIGGWMWGGTDIKESIAAIHKSIDLGVTSIDTAAVYGYGLSEEIVGEALQGISRDKIQIMTKCGVRWDTTDGYLAFTSDNADGTSTDIYRNSTKEGIIYECENSLKRLKTDYIDLYQIHWPDPTTPIEESIEALKRLQEQGKIRAVGVSNYSAEQMKTAETVFGLASNQVPFSMVERTVEEELVPYCIENNKAILAYSPLQRGILSGKITPGYKFPDGDHRPETGFYKSENIIRINAFLDKIKPLAQDKNCSLSQLVIRWTIERPGITIALVGARNAAQAEQNAKAVDVKLTDEEIEFINTHLYELKLV